MADVQPSTAVDRNITGICTDGLDSVGNSRVKAQYESTTIATSSAYTSLQHTTRKRAGHERPRPGLNCRYD